jgi:hypothetical protein
MRPHADNFYNAFIEFSGSVLCVLIVRQNFIHKAVLAIDTARVRAL